ncbi:MAG: type II secretion system protein [Candidatus Sumerlaeia bacterium]
MITRTHRKHQAFTLIEILIISALIALFSGLAIISMQYLVDSSKRKSVFADARTIGSALGAAHMDLGMIPKIGYMSYSKSMLIQTSGNDTQLPVDFDTIGLFTGGNTPLAPQVLENWVGPFLPNSKGRSGISPAGVGYTARMQMATQKADGDYQILDWPADPWGNPYVVYLLKLRKVGEGFEPSWIYTPYEKADYVALVVSYGKNEIPGGSSDPGGVTPQIREAVIDGNFMMYEDPYVPNRADFRSLTVAEHTASRWRALHNKQGWEEEGFDNFEYLPGYPEVPGIMDSGSDDIYFHIP